MREMLTIKEIAAYLGITERTTYRWMIEKKIPGVKIGGSWRCRKKILDEWIDNNHKGGQKSEKSQEKRRRENETRIIKNNLNLLKKHKGKKKNATS